MITYEELNTENDSITELSNVLLYLFHETFNVRYRCLLRTISPLYE